MVLTHRRSTPLAGSGHGATAVAAVVFLVLAVVGVHLVCSMQLNEHTGGVTQTHVEHHQGDVVEPEASGSSDCSEHDTVTVQSEPLLLPSLVLATVPERTAICRTPAAVHQDHQMSSALVRAAAPSLHALGINRT